MHFLPMNFLGSFSIDNDAFFEDLCFFLFFVFTYNLHVLSLINNITSLLAYYVNTNHKSFYKDISPS